MRNTLVLLILVLLSSCAGSQDGPKKSLKEKTEKSQASSSTKKADGQASSEPSMTPEQVAKANSIISDVSKDEVKK